MTTHTLTLSRLGIFVSFYVRSGQDPKISHLPLLRLFVSYNGHGLWLQTVKPRIVSTASDRKQTKSTGARNV